MIQIVIALAVAAVLTAGAYFKGRTDGAEPWIEQYAALESQLHTLKTTGDERAKRAEATAAKATKELAALRKQLESERAKTEQGVMAAWREHLDRLRDANSGADALAAARADGAACRGALDTVLAAALDVHRAAILNTEQLRQLQEWVKEASK